MPNVSATPSSVPSFAPSDIPSDIPSTANIVNDDLFLTEIGKGKGKGVGLGKGDGLLVGKGVGLGKGVGVGKKGGKKGGKKDGKKGGKKGYGGIIAGPDDDSSTADDIFLPALPNVSATPSSVPSFAPSDIPSDIPSTANIVNDDLFLTEIGKGNGKGVGRGKKCGKKGGKKGADDDGSTDDYFFTFSPNDSALISSPSFDILPISPSFSPSPTHELFYVPSSFPSDTPPLPSSSIRSMISKISLQGGKEFEDADSYQSKALHFLETVLSRQDDKQYVQYYALACIYTASFGVENKYTKAEFPDGDLPGWTNSGLWMTDSDFCNWFGITCESTLVHSIVLDDNNMTGIFAPEVQLLAESLKELDLDGNTLLLSEGDDGNNWMSKMVNMEFLYLGSTSFEYYGVPTFINKMRGLSK